MIRVAHAGDVRALAAFAEQTFRDTFASTNTASDMDLYCAAAFGPEIQMRELADPDTRTLLVEQHDALIGYAQLHAGDALACVGGTSPIELKRFYVAGCFHGTGLAATLMSAVVDLAGANGNDVMWLGVWEKNPRAIRFYSKCGFAAVGDHVFVVGTDPQRDVIMARALSRT